MHILVGTGNGLGNVIQSTPIVTYLVANRHTVDILLARAPAEAEQLLRLPKMEAYLSYITTDFHDLPVRKYDVIIANFLTNIPPDIKGPVYKAENPLRANQAEWLTNCHALKKAAHAHNLGPLQDIQNNCCTYVHRMQCKFWDIPSGSTVIGILPGGKLKEYWHKKRYPYYDKVAAQLLRRFKDIYIVVLGLPEDGPFTMINPRIRDYRDRYSLAEVADALGRCSFAIANDCGLAHVSCAVGTKTGIIWGPSNIVKNEPVQNAIKIVAPIDITCRPCQGKAEIERTCDRKCMKKLAPEHVVDVIAKYIR